MHAESYLGAQKLFDTCGVPFGRQPLNETVGLGVALFGFWYCVHFRIRMVQLLELTEPETTGSSSHDVTRFVQVWDHPSIVIGLIVLDGDLLLV